MPDQVTDQLRRYGDAVERLVLGEEIATTAPPARPWRRPLLAAAAAVALLVVGVVALSWQDESRTTQLATEDGMPASTTPTSLFGPLALTGTATWVGGGDPRAELRVGACPVDDVALRCPTMRSATVAADGSFSLELPGDSRREWRVVVYVPATNPACVFNCRFPDAPRNAAVGPVNVVPAASASQPLALSVSARVVDVYVRDRDGLPFAGGGVQVTDSRCPDRDCTGDLVPMFVMASATDGAVRLVLDPAVSYEIHGQASNTGWPDPAWTNGDNTFWFSPSVTVYGSDLAEGHTFVVDGGAS